MSHGDYKAFFAAACAGDVSLVEHHLDTGVAVDFIHAELQSTAHRRPCDPRSSR